MTVGEGQARCGIYVSLYVYIITVLGYIVLVRFALLLRLARHRVQQLAGPVDPEQCSVQELSLIHI